LKLLNEERQKVCQVNSSIVCWLCFEISAK
jgi:hypothetical protein